MTSGDETDVLDSIPKITSMIEAAQAVASVYNLLQNLLVSGEQNAMMLSSIFLGMRSLRDYINIQLRGDDIDVGG